METLNIKSWAEADRPREKLLQKGRHILSDAELIALLIRSGSKKESAVELSKRILNDVNHNLNELSKLSVAELMKFRGIGEAKAISIVAALELGRRRKEKEVAKRFRIVTSADVFEYLQEDMIDLSHEEFWILLLDRSNQVLRKINISKGGIAGTVVDSRLIFKQAIEQLASSVILCHNHPSGNLTPSESDIKLTQKLKEKGVILEIPIIDHVIVAENAYFSFADEGLL